MTEKMSYIVFLTAEAHMNPYTVAYVMMCMRMKGGSSQPTTPKTPKR